jgi:beta propeller repeat protein
VRRCALIPAIALTSLLGGCSGYRLLNLPYDASGRSLSSPYEDTSPQVSGRYVAFVSDRGGSQDVYLYDLTTRQLVDLPGLNALDTIAAEPDISGDGRYIVFSGSRLGESDIYLYDRQTRQLRNFTLTLKAGVRRPTISADGSTIAFESNASGQWDIVLYNRAGQPLDIPTNPR